MLAYMRDHWHGRLGLAVSFWINLVAVRAVFFGLQTLLAPAEETDYSALALPVLIAAFTAHGLLLVWQIVGVLRSAEHHFRETGSQGTSWGVQLACVLAFFLTATYALQAWQFTQPVIIEESPLIAMERERQTRYTLNVDGSVLSLVGSIELGVTRRVREAVAANPQVETILLDSDGGNIYEARGLAELIAEGGLNTRVETRCNSACTIAFSGGIRREMAEDAQMGFHQYRLDSDLVVIAADPAGEQARDIERFRKAGYSQAFLDRVFTSSPREMWFPDRQELVAGGVLSAVPNLPPTQ